MSNKIIDSLISGALTAKGVATFDKSKQAYIITFQNGNVGVYAETPRTSLYNYMEYHLTPTGSIIASPKMPKTFSIGTSINSFFSSVLNTNSEISDISSEELASTVVVNPSFITDVLVYNPKASNVLEPLELSKYVISAEDEAKYNKAKAYYDAIINRQTVKEITEVLIKTVTSFIKNMISVTQKAGTNAWTINGMLALDIKTAMALDQTIPNAYGELNRKYREFSMVNPPSFTEVFAKAIIPLPWTLAKELDLELNPYLYLYPRGVKNSKTGQAVSVNDPSVKML